MEKQALTRILMVEDEPDIQMVARVALENLGGLQVDMCSSGAEALERVPKLQPQLILMDVMMPALDGPMTLKSLREKPECARIPVVFMTAKVQTHEIARFTALGALAVIAKPFNPMTLADVVKAVWEKEQASGRECA